MKEYYKIILIVIVILIIRQLFKAVKMQQQIAEPVNQNILGAFQNVIEFAEHGKIDNSNYYKHFGGSITADLSTHPNKLIKLSGYKSTAFGRFQYIYSTWQMLAIKYGINDMQPPSQNELNKKHLIDLGVLDALINEDFELALKKAGNVWASLPGSKFGQSRYNVADLKAVYNNYI